MAAFAPTTEQTAALNLFRSNASLAIEAGAGTGKTSTLKLLAESTPRRGQYIAFNKAIVDESKSKFPSTVKCNTAHSLAMRDVGVRFKHRLPTARIKSAELANMLNMTPLSITKPDGKEKRLGPAYLAGLTMRGITNFCQSADLEPDVQHVPYINGIDIPPGAMQNNTLVASHLVPFMRRAWADLNDPKGSLPYKHEHYLKTWQLSGPRIGAQYILFDEAQDANPVMRAVVEAQTHAQIVWVGDSQQQIYSFTGAVNALAEVDTDHRTFLTQSFRFGEAVAEQANLVLAALNAELRISGTPTIPSTVGRIADPQVVLTRTNAMAVHTVLDAQREGRKPYLVGGAGDVASFARAAQNLKEGRRTEHPELACFDSWSEVVEYVAQDEQGSDLRLLVNLIDEFGVQTILSALDGMTGSEAGADLIVSTAHKSKGREWDRVKLAPDFPDQPQDEELRLLYVAVTRAKLQLDVSAVSWFHGAQNGSQRVAEAVVEEMDNDPIADLHPDLTGEDTPPVIEHSLEQHLQGVAGEYDLWADGLLLGKHAESKVAMETASKLYGTGAFRVVNVYDARTGTLVVQYEA